MQLIDYIFYRLYITYKKANEGPVFSTVLLFSTFLGLHIGIPIMTFCVMFFDAGKTVLTIVSFSAFAIGIILTLRRYTKKRINEIQRKYRFSKWNKWLKTWIIFFIIVLLFPLSPFLIPMWGYFFRFVYDLIQSLG